MCYISALPCDSENHSEVSQLRKLCLNDPIEIFDNDETSSPSQVFQRKLDIRHWPSNV